MDQEQGADLYELYELFLKNDNSVRKTSREVGVARSTIRRRLDKFQELSGINWRDPVASGNIQGLEGTSRKLPKKGTIKRYILSSAQNNTYVHKDFLYNLEVYARYLNAEILISQFSYNKAAYGQKAIKPGTEPSREDMAKLWFDDKLDPYICNDRVLLTPTLMFCGEINILPTAVRPLSGFESYAGAGVSGIFPHTTIALESIAALSEEDVKFNYSTGSVTIKNYITKKAGYKAEHRHCFAALIAEVNHEGDWWVRQLNASDDGTFYDLGIRVKAGKVTTGNRVEAINWGDVHVEVTDKEILKMNWGSAGMMDTLKPRHQFMHDVLDFHSRNHHRIKDQHAMYERYVEGRDSVRDEMRRVMVFLNKTAHRSWCKTIVVDSNHDNALERWLKEADYKKDHVNALFYLETQTMKYRAVDEGNKKFHLVESVLRELGVHKDIRFLRDDESFLICGEIESGMHGHLGVNGARGYALSFSKTGRKSNTGHTHSAQILHGAYVAGTSSEKRLEYNKGLSSWSHSHIITYLSGKRCIVTAKKGKWRA